MNKATAQKFRTAFQSAVKGLEEQFNCTLEIGNITFGDTGLHTKLTLTENGENGEKVSVSANDFKRFAFSYGLQEGDLGKKFVSNGEVFEITGCKPKSNKYPILGKNVATGRTFKFTANGVKFGMRMYAERNQKA